MPRLYHPYWKNAQIRLTKKITKLTKKFAGEQNIANKRIAYAQLQEHATFKMADPLVQFIVAHERRQQLLEDRMALESEIVGLLYALEGASVPHDELGLKAYKDAARAFSGKIGYVKYEDLERIITERYPGLHRPEVDG